MLKLQEEKLKESRRLFLEETVDAGSNAFSERSELTLSNALLADQFSKIYNLTTCSVSNILCEPISS